MAQLNFQMPDELLARLDEAKPDYLDRKGFLCLLLDMALDTSCTLGKPSRSTAITKPEGGEGFTSTSTLTSNKQVITNNRNIKARNSQIKRTKGSADFEAFWAAYQSSPSKANAQSKAKAWEVYREVIKYVEPQRLLEAARRAVEEVERLTSSQEFCSPLPDCFRWLRDERYAVLLEGHTPAQADGVWR